jgi:hypothetical protein
MAASGTDLLRWHGTRLCQRVPYGLVSDDVCQDVGSTKCLVVRDEIREGSGVEA